MKQFFTLAFLSYNLAFTQVKELNIPDKKYVPEKWSASWITHPDISLSDYNVVLFRKTLELSSKPDSYIINITADNRYKLFINGKYVCYGPQLSDIRHWRFETIDISNYLQKGKNTIAVEVVNFGHDRFFGQISSKTGLIVNGYSDKTISTEDKTWKVYQNKAVAAKHPNWMYAVDINGGFYASNPGDSVNANYYPWGWQSTDFNDSNWQTAKWLSGAAAWGGSFAWMLTPRTTPIQKDTIERFTKIVKSENTKIASNFLQGNSALVIPQNTKASFLIDHNFLTLGYPQLKVSGGKNAIIKIKYAENLYNKDRSRANRNDILDKIFIGLYDKYVCDGGNSRIFSPLWYRSFRFIQVEIETKDEALKIEDYYNIFSAAPIQTKASFKSDNALYDNVMDICWRTARILTQDNLVSDAYYEQMQYVGDSRVHAMTNLYMSGESLWLKNCIEQFNYSRLPDGQITSCYPLRATFVHPTFTLIWIDMVKDYMMYVDDKPFVENQLSNIQQSLWWYENHLNENGLLGKSEWPYFVDWYRKVKGEGNGGTANVSRDGNSAVITLHYIFTLQNAAKIFAFCGKNYESEQYLKRAKQLQENVIKQCYDEKKGVFYEDPAKTFACQRPNLMAVLTNTIPADKQKDLMEKIIPDTTISQAGLYYRYNMFAAMSQSKTGHLMDEALKPWKKLLDYGLTTTTEVPLDPFLDQRSDAHPWSSSPAMAFFSVICGIQPSEPGYKSVTIAPQMGKLTFIKARHPHYLGEINIDLKRNKENIEGEIILPQGLKGVFKWNGKEINLNAGNQKIKL